MKTILYAGISANGFIAKPDGNSEFTSEENLKGFFEHSKIAGNVVMGKNTFLEASKRGYFPFPGTLNVVVTHDNIENKWNSQVIFVSLPPKEISEMLAEKGYKTLFLAGGGKLNSSFMEAGLVDEIFLDIEPVVFGAGIPLFSGGDLVLNLELLNTRRLNADTVQLHYKVKK